MELVGGGSVINGATPFSYWKRALNKDINILAQSLCLSHKYIKKIYIYIITTACSRAVLYDIKIYPNTTYVPL